MRATGRLGQRLRQRREAAGWTQARLAKAVGVTDAYISMIERGVKRNPSLLVLTRIAKRLDTALDELLS